MERKRILIFSLSYFPFVGGAGGAVKEITDRLPEFDFEIISADIRNFWSKYLYPFWAYRQAARQQQRQPYALVWAIMANQAGMAAALLKKRFPKMSFLLTLQEGDELQSFAYQLRLLGPRLFQVFHRADYITVISNYLARWARQMGAKCPIAVVPNGVDFSSFQLLGSNFRNNKKENKIVITTSRLVRKNGVDTLIEAMQFLPDNVKLQILGTGPEKISLTQLMSRLSLDNPVEFLGRVPPDEIPNYLVNADIFVRPSRSEGLGNSFLAAMAAGVPIVGTPVGGIPDFLKGDTLADFKVSPWEQQTGWFCEVDNPESIAEKVKFILDPANRGEVESVVANARQLVREKYDWETIPQTMAQVIAKLV